MNAPEAVPPCTPPKATGNGGACRVDPVGQMNSSSDSEDSDEPQSAMSKRKWNGRESWKMIKRWVTGEQAEMDQDDIDRELFELARDWMEVSKLSCHVAKETDVALCKQFREYPKQKGAILVQFFRCTLRH